MRACVCMCLRLGLYVNNEQMTWRRPCVRVRFFVGSRPRSTAIDEATTVCLSGLQRETFSWGLAVNPGSREEGGRGSRGVDYSKVCDDGRDWERKGCVSAGVSTKRTVRLLTTPALKAV